MKTVVYLLHSHEEKKSRVALVCKQECWVGEGGEKLK